MSDFKVWAGSVKLQLIEKFPSLTSSSSETAEGDEPSIFDGLTSEDLIALSEDSDQVAPSAENDENIAEFLTAGSDVTIPDFKVVNKNFNFG